MWKYKAILFEVVVWTCEPSRGWGQVWGNDSRALSQPPLSPHWHPKQGHGPRILAPCLGKAAAFPFFKPNLQRLHHPFDTKNTPNPRDENSLRTSPSVNHHHSRGFCSCKAFSAASVGAASSEARAEAPAPTAEQGHFSTFCWSS